MQVLKKKDILIYLNQRNFINLDADIYKIEFYKSLK